MTASALLARRVIVAGLGVGAVLAAGAGTAAAAPQPGCSLGDVAAVEAQVATAMSAYLFTHPDVNETLSGFQGLPEEQLKSKTKAYLAANPPVQDAMNAIRQPGFDLRARCGFPPNTIIRGVL